MRNNKISCFLGLSIILALLVLLSPIPTHAAGGVITLYPTEGKIGDWIKTDGWGFDANRVVHIYFSSHKAGVGDDIDKVLAYKLVVVASINAGGAFTSFCQFVVPEALTDGKREEDVHGGDYYVYATYYDDKAILCLAKFIVIDGEIELDPEEGTVGMEVMISGEGLRQNQKITVEYDGHRVDITSGDTETDNNGKFACTIIIPESVAGSYTITVTDESGNKPEAEFSVKPEITLDPTTPVVGEVVEVSGTGFAKGMVITLTFDGGSIGTTPASIETNRLGSFSCSFVVPLVDSCGVRKIRASDRGFSWAEAQLTVLAGITLSPITSLASPGNVGMELTVRGAGFIAGAEIAVTYTIDGEVIPVATATADDDGNLSVKFAVPASVAGSHAVTATDGTTSVTSTFTMESQPPPLPRLLLPEIGSTSGAEAYFNWVDVTDPSGVSYTLQVAADANFTTIVLEKEGLPQSEYAMSEEEELAPTKASAPYYWRVRAVDGASNEGNWSFSSLFYVGFFPLSNWVLYTFCGLGVLLLVIAVFWWRRRRVGSFKQ